MAKNGAPELRSIQVRTKEICPFQARVPKLRAAQIRVTKIEFVELVEPPGRITVPKNRQDRLDVCSWRRFVTFTGGGIPSCVMPHVSSQDVCDRPVILRPVPGDPVEGVDASQPHFNVWLAILELRAELTRCLNEASSQLPL